MEFGEWRGNRGTQTRIRVLTATMQSADTRAMDDMQAAEYRQFISVTWAQAVNLKEGENLPHTIFIVSIDKNGYKHEEPSYFLRHIFNNHNGEKTEAARGLKAITEQDFYTIPSIVETPDYTMKKIKYDDQDSVLYVKYGKNNTYIYVERISNKKRRLSAVTFYNFMGKIPEQGIITHMKNNKRYDISNIEIIGKGGGNPTGPASTEQRSAAATSAIPTDTLNITPSAEKSSREESGQGEIVCGAFL